MNNLTGRVTAALAFGITCLLSACGGSGDSSSTSGSTPVAAYSVTGTVAYGHPVANQTVQGIDSTGKTCGQAGTGPDGSFSMDTSTCAAGSAAFTVAGYTTPSGASLMAIAVPPAGMPVVNGVVNLDPLTTVIAYDAAGMVGSSSAPGTSAQALALLPQVTSQQYQQAQSDILTPSLLQLLQTTYGVSSSSFSASATSFAANGQGLDAFFDAFTLTAPTAASVQLAPASGTGISISVTLPSTANKASSTTSGSTVASTVSYAVGGTVAGLSGGSVTLLINGGNPLTIASNATFVFPTPIANTYAVTVGTQPPGQVCSVGHGSGAGLTANVTNVAVTCSTITYTVGGSASGLGSGDQLTLDNNAGDGTILAANGTFIFATPVAYHGSYNVTVGLAPAGKTCTVSNGSGTGISANVTNVAVTCSAINYTVGGTVSGLSGSMSLLNNGANSTTVVANGSFTFAIPVVQGASYNVTVGNQPTDQTCSVTNGTGTVGSSNITNVGVTCVITSHIVYIYAPGNNNNQLFGYQVDTVGGTVSPVPGSPFTTAVASNASTAWVATDANAKFLYAVNRNSNTISAYTIDHTTGSLTAIVGSPFATGASQPYSITLNAAGTLAFVPNASSNSIGVYSIDQVTGALSQIMGSPFTAGSVPTQLAITPNGEFVYAGNSGSPAVSGFQIDQTTGALTPVPNSPYTYSNSGDVPISMATNPAGTVVYALNGSGTINAYAIDQSTGALTSISGSPFTGSSSYGGRSMTLNAAGTMAFVASGNGGPVLTFNVDTTTGALTQITSDSYGGQGQGPWYVALDPNGTLAYVSNAVGVTLGIANLNPVTGALTDIPGSPFGIDSRAADIVVVQP